MFESIKITHYQSSEKLSLLQQIDKAQKTQIMPNALQEIDLGKSGTGFTPPSLNEMLTTGIKHLDQPLKKLSDEDIRARQLIFLKKRLNDIFNS